MADSFFGIDISSSNLNDDEGGGEPSEDEYDALNDETFGQDSEEFDWEYEHEQLAGQLESSRRHAALDDADSRLEASLSQLVLDETDAPRSLGSSVWRHDLAFPTATRTVQQQTLKNVCTVEELERQLRHNQPQNYTQNYFQPRFPPVILQRPPGMQAPLPLPFAPQQPMAHNINQMNQPLNKIIGQNSQINQMGQSNLMNHMTQNINQLGNNMNHMNQNMNQMGQGINQMGQNVNPIGQNINQIEHNVMGYNVNQFIQKTNQMNQYQNNQMGQGMMNQMHNINVHPMNQNNHMMQNQMGQNMNQHNQMVQNPGSNMNQMGQMPQNMNQGGQNMNQGGQNLNQMGQNLNQIGPNQMIPNGNQFGMNQYQQMMAQPRMMAPPPGMAMPRQNFTPNLNQFNPNFRGQMPAKNDQQISQTNMVMNHNKNQTQNPNQIQKTNQLSPKQKPVQNLNQVPNAPKLQKSRVYSNKNLTSQNLVQLIQNTHPMLNFNNSFHNASHHPMLNNRNLFSNQIVNHPMFNNRQNGSIPNINRSGSEEVDEYAGLMTAREKHWLVNIQMLQLNTGTPYLHDFYYTVFLERQANKEKEGVKEAHKANQQNHPFYSGGKQEVNLAIRQRERHNSHRHNSTGEDPRTYVPTQFENSLGKLQCGSVTAPRKIIDVEVVGAEPASQRGSRAPSAASNNPAEVPREMRRTKQLLLDIEALYFILLRLEELNDPLAISNALILKEREEKQKQLELAQKEAEEEEDCNLFLKNIESVQRRPKQDSPKSDCVDKRQNCPTSYLPVDVVRRKALKTYNTSSSESSSRSGTPFHYVKEGKDERVSVREFYNKVVNLTINQKPQPVKNLLDEDKDELLNKMFAGLLHGDRIAQILTVRKGRALLARFLSRAPPAHVRLRTLWARVLRALPAAARRDDGGLRALAPHYRKYMLAAQGWGAVLESCGALGDALDPARGHHALTSQLTLSCVCALVERASLLTGVEGCAGERQWRGFLAGVARALSLAPTPPAPPARPLARRRLQPHLARLDPDAAERLRTHLC